MKKKSRAFLIVVIIFIFLSVISYLIYQKSTVSRENFYIMTYEHTSKMHKEYQDFYDKDFKYLKTILSPKFEYLRYDGFKDVNIGSTINKDDNVDICIDDKCKNFKETLMPNGYTQDIHISENAQILVRMFNTDTLENTELFNVSNNKSFVTEAMIMYRGYDDGKYIWFSGSSTIIDPGSYFYKIDPQTMELVEKIEVNDNDMFMSLYITEGKIYFISPIKDKLFEYVNGTFIEGNIVNPMYIKENPNDTMIFSVASYRGKSFYAFENPVTGTFLTNMTETIPIGHNIRFNDSFVTPNNDELTIFMFDDAAEHTKEYWGNTIKYVFNMKDFTLKSKLEDKTGFYHGMWSIKK